MPNNEETKTYWCPECDEEISVIMEEYDATMYGYERRSRGIESEEIINYYDADFTDSEVDTGDLIKEECPECGGEICMEDVIEYSKEKRKTEKKEEEKEEKRKDEDKDEDERPIIRQGKTSELLDSREASFEMTYARQVRESFTLCKCGEKIEFENPNEEIECPNCNRLVIKEKINGPYDNPSAYAASGYAPFDQS